MHTKCFIGIRLVIVSLLTAFSAAAAGLQVEGVEVPEQINVGAQKLVLNGAGLRTKRKFGINFKVYVGALYVTSKTQDVNSLIKGSETKVLELIFLRNLDAETLRAAWSEGFEKNCANECDAARAQFQIFNQVMTDVKAQQRMKLIFSDQDVNIEIQGEAIRTQKVSGEAIRKSLMSLFIGEHPPTPELKKALLGLD